MCHGNDCAASYGAKSKNLVDVRRDRFRNRFIEILRQKVRRFLQRTVSALLYPIT
jgi:hypothetical protein